MYTYIQKDADNTYVELSFLLDENYKVGDTWESYLDGSWVLLTKEQLEFKDTNPTATVEQVFYMEIKENPAYVPTPEERLRTAKQKKITEVYRKDNESNRFFIILGEETILMWLDKNTRNSLLNVTIPAEKAKGNLTTTLWYEGKPYEDIPPVSIKVPIAWVEEHIPELEIYAKNTYDLRNKNIALIMTAITEEQVNEIDIALNYPQPLVFDISISATGGG